MRERERELPELVFGAAPGATDGLDGLRERAERFLAAGDEIMDRLLSGDSEAFLRANRQQGGQ